MNHLTPYDLKMYPGREISLISERKEEEGHLIYLMLHPKNQEKKVKIVTRCGIDLYQGPDFVSRRGRQIALRQLIFAADAKDDFDYAIAMILDEKELDSGLVLLGSARHLSLLDSKKALDDIARSDDWWKNLKIHRKGMNPLSGRI